MIDIVEILGRSEAGLTEPFICRGSNEEIFYVKGKYAGRRSLLCEWIAGNLALKIGLPIAPFEIVNIPEQLISMSPSGLSPHHLGVGPAFGSVKQQVSTIQFTQLNSLPKELMLNVLAFDFWIRNQDRTLTEKSGNPNLFWNPGNSKIVVLDHNMAFDPEFNKDEFFEFHVFCCAKSLLRDSHDQRVDLLNRMTSALAGWDNILNEIPIEWNFIDDEQTIEVTDIDLNEIRESLASTIQSELWLG